MNGGNFKELEVLFGRCLKTVLSIPLWRLYLFYVRHYQLKNIADESEARQLMLKAFDFATLNVGLDAQSGPIWSEYIEYVHNSFTKLVNNFLVFAFSL